MIEESENYGKQYPTAKSIKELWDQYLLRAKNPMDADDAFRQYIHALYAAHCSNVDLPKGLAKALENGDRMVTATSIMEEVDLIVKELKLLLKCDRGEELNVDEVQFLLSRKLNACEYDLVYRRILDTMPGIEPTIETVERNAAWVKQMAESVREELQRFEEGGKQDDAD